MAARGGGVDRDDVLARVDLEQLLDHLTGPADQRRRWHCPERDHPDEHPSVTVRVNADGTQRWRCWSGDHGGTAIDAVIAAHGSDVATALRWLAAHHTNLPAIDRPPTAPVATPGHPDPALAVYVERAARLLWTPAGAAQRDWLHERGLEADVLRANRVGADPGRRHLPRPRGMPGGWPAVIYPALDAAGGVTYLQARYLHPPANRSKYDNPSARLAANPRLAWTVPTHPPQRGGGLVVCEGVCDALVATQDGFRSVAVLGAAYPDGRVADGITATVNADPTLRDGTIDVCFDNDAAGRAGATRLVELLADRHLAATAVTPPDGLDVTEWALHDRMWSTAVTCRTPPPPPPRPPPTPPTPPAPVDPGRPAPVRGLRRSISLSIGR